MSSVACRVCLRTNLPMQDLPDQLKTFHEELCELETVQHKSLKYCATCAHQMKKFYKFKGQCLRANGLLKLWIKQKTKDISEYRKELPSPSIQITNNSTSFLFECQHGDKALHNTNVTSDCNQNLILKLNRSALAPDGIMHPESSELGLNSYPNIPDQPNLDIRPAVRLSSILKPAFRPNIGLRPAFKPNIALRPAFKPNSVLRTGFRPNFGVASDLRPRLKTEHVNAENGIITIDPNLITSMQSRPALRPNPGLELSIQLEPSGDKQPKQADLTFDPDFDISYETDPLSVVKEESAMDIDENTMDIIENTVDIVSKEDIEKQEVEDKDDNTIDIDDAVASVVEIEQKEIDNSEYIDRTIPNDENVNSNDSVDSKEDELINRENETDNDIDSIDNKEDDFINKEDETDNDIDSIDNKEDKLINRENETDNDIDSIDNEEDNDIDSDEYEYEYLEQDIELLDFAKSKQEKPSEVTNIEKNQAKKTTVKEPKIIILKIENSNKNVPQPAQNETISPLEEKVKRITRKYVKKSKATLDSQHTYISPGFKAVPTFKDKMFGLFDQYPFVLEDETVLTKELFSVIYDKFNVRELKRLAIIILEEDFRRKLTTYLGILYRKYNPEYESIFHVEYLHTEEKKKEEFKRRELHPDYIRAAYKCELCYKTYTGQNFLDYHKKVYHDPASPLVCSICSYSMPTRARLIKHRLQNHQAAYSCKLCPLRTNLVAVMRNHYSSHKGAQYQCSLCFNVFYNANTLSNHKRRAHATHVCSTCAQQYTTEKGLQAHRETHHKNVPPPQPALAVPCAACNITFDSRQSYQRHCLIAHTSLPDQSFPRRKRIRAPPTAPTGPTAPTAPTTPKVHKETEKNKQIKKGNEKKKRVYRTCEVCHEKVYVEKFSGFLYKHFQDKHPGVPYHAQGMQARDYLCDECGKSFNCQATLKDHKNSHTGVRPYMCELCPARFHTKSRLWAHRGQHRSERRHRCEECGKLFKNSTHLWTHKKIHIGDRRFKCHICNKGFLHNSSLKEHVKGVHYKERRVKRTKKQTQETLGPGAYLQHRYRTEQ